MSHPVSNYCDCPICQHHFLSDENLNEEKEDLNQWEEKYFSAEYYFFR